MKITQDVRDYAASLGNNEKRALGLDGASASGLSPHPEEGARAPVSKDEAQQARQRRLEQEAGMAAMSEKFRQMGGEVYLDAQKVKDSNKSL